MIQMTIAKHAVAFPSKVLARDGGKHIYRVRREINGFTEHTRSIKYRIF